MSILSHTCQLPLFSQPWWLDAVCGKGKWGMAEVRRGDGEILGICPYYLNSFLGIKTIRMPPYTPYQGIWLNEALLPEKLVSRYNAEMRIIRQLVAQLPPVAWFSQVQEPGFENWLPFYWTKYRMKARYSYLLPPVSKKETRAQMTTYCRNRLRNAREKFVINRVDSIKKFIQFYNRCMKRQGLQIKGKHLHIMNKLHREISNHKGGEIFSLIDNEGSPVAMVYQIWDDRYSYYWMPALDKRLGSGGAAQLLIYLLIEKSHAAGRIFNFEGSMLPHIEPVFRAFGAKRVPVYQIYKASNRILYAAKELLGK